MSKQSFIGNLGHGLSVQAGFVPYQELIHVIGRNESVPNAAWEILNAAGIDNWKMAAAEVINVKLGGNAADTAAGNGARTILIEGLDATGVEISETITLAGASASSATTQSFLRVLNAKVSSSGVRFATNTAAIVIENASNEEILHIEAGEGKAEFSGYTVPLGKTAYILDYTVDVAAAKPASLRCMYCSGILTAAAPFSPTIQVAFIDELIGQAGENGHGALLIVPELTDIWWEAYGKGAQTAADVDYEILLLDNA